MITCRFALVSNSLQLASGSSSETKIVTMKSKNIEQNTTQERLSFDHNTVNQIF
jgi:hypothetical protein